MKINFTKMHGAGNDYVYIDCFKEDISKIRDINRFARWVSDRHFGVGGDGLILIMPSDRADVRMRMFNSDGSEAQMCGNGVRCLAKYAFDDGIVKGSDFVVETLAGNIGINILEQRDGSASLIRVNMGSPIFEPDRIPVSVDNVAGFKIKVVDREFVGYSLSMGNPHVVIFLDENIDNFDVKKYGSAIERHKLFPQRVNVEFINVVGDSKIKQRTWERGSGETLACGTGACASAIWSIKNGYCKEGRVEVSLMGGDLFVEYSGDDNDVYLIGSGEYVFWGYIDISESYF